MKSVMTHQFSQVPKADIPRSSFDRSHGCKTTFEAGQLVPIYVDEALPGDTFNLKMTAFARLATPIFPIMDNMFMETFFFSVPNRLLWDNWQKFNGEQTDPGDSTDFTVPICNSGTSVSVGTVGDYMGIPDGLIPDNTDISALPFRAYRLIYNEWFRDQNLIDSVPTVTDDGPDSDAQAGFDSIPLSRGKRHDYFTSALPWPQKGDSVEMPLGATAGIATDVVGTVTPSSVWSTDTSDYQQLTSSTATVQTSVATGTAATQLYADLSTATAATINQLRQAFQIQKLLERDARGGTRYTEIIRAHFGVTSPDARLQRPEFLGGGSSMVNISPIPQTSETSGSPQGNLAAFGTASLNNHGFTASFTEHCTLIGLVNVRADLTYQQGLNRMWSRSTRYDFYWPALALIGEQIIANKEIWVTAADTGTVNDAAFGYQERYAEYRYKPSVITGKFKSDVAGTLDAWHLSEDFATLPVLDETFITSAPPVDRVIAVPSEPHFLFDAFFNLRCARPMPIYGVPGLIDHF